MWILVIGILCMGIGALGFRFLPIPKKLPQILNNALYYVGIPLQIVALVRRSDFSHLFLWTPILTTLAALLLGTGLAVLSLQLVRVLEVVYMQVAIHRFRSAQLSPQMLHSEVNSSSSFYEISDCGIEQQNSLLPQVNQLFSHIIPQRRPGQGSFILASMMSNSGYIGLAVAPAFVSQSYWIWIAAYHLVNSVFGFFVLGIILANYFSGSQNTSVLTLTRNVLYVPALWAFLIGWCTRDIPLFFPIEYSLQSSRWLVNFGAFLLTGFQLNQLRQLDGLMQALIPTVLKIIALPALVGIGLTLFGATGDSRFSMVLMAGTPTALTAAILSENFKLDRQITANIILLSTLAFPLTILLWVALFK